MSDKDVAVEPPMPCSAKLFTPWRWFRQMRPWQRWALLTVGVIAGYVESPVLLNLIFSHSSLYPVGVYLEPLCEAGWYPLKQAYHASPWVQAFYDGQANIIERLFELIDADS